jgi:hypothetical protein
MIETNPKKIEIKIADEMAETGYLAYRIKKKNNIKHLSLLSQDTLRNLIIKIEGTKGRSEVATVNEITSYNRYILINSLSTRYMM